MMFSTIKENLKHTRSTRQRFPSCVDNSGPNKIGVNEPLEARHRRLATSATREHWPAYRTAESEPNLRRRTFFRAVAIFQLPVIKSLTLKRGPHVTGP